MKSRFLKSIIWIISVSSVLVADVIGEKKMLSGNNIDMLLKSREWSVYTRLYNEISTATTKKQLDKISDEMSTLVFSLSKTLPTESSLIDNLLALKKSKIESAAAKYLTRGPKSMPGARYVRPPKPDYFQLISERMKNLELKNAILIKIGKNNFKHDFIKNTIAKEMIDSINALNYYMELESKDREVTKEKITEDDIDLLWKAREIINESNKLIVIMDVHNP